MAAKGSVPEFTTLKQCLEFLEWLHSDRQGRLMQGLVAHRLDKLLKKMYESVDQKSVAEELSKFLTHVSNFYRKICTKPIGSYAGNKSAKDTLNYFLQCVPKLLSTIYFLRYHVDSRFSAMGGGRWADQEVGLVALHESMATDLDRYLVETVDKNKYGVIPGGFQNREVKMGHRSGYNPGSAMAADLQNILEKYSNQDKQNYFLDVYSTTVLSTFGSDTPNIANALRLVQDFCKIFEAVRDDKDFESHLYAKDRCIKLEDLKRHCAELKGPLGQLFNQKAFSFTGYAREYHKLKTQDIAKKLASWFKRNLDKVRTQLMKVQSIASSTQINNKSFRGSAVLGGQSKALAEYFNKNLLRYGFTFHGYDFNRWKTHDVLTKDWSDVIEKLNKADEGLDKLKKILDGDSCPAVKPDEDEEDKEEPVDEVLEGERVVRVPPKVEAPPVKVPEAPKEVVPEKIAETAQNQGKKVEGAQNQGKKAEGAQNQGKKAEGGQSQAGGQSEEKRGSSPVVQAPQTHTSSDSSAGSGSPGDHGAISGQGQDGQAGDSDAGQPVGHGPQTNVSDSVATSSAAGSSSGSGGSPGRGGHVPGASNDQESQTKKLTCADGYTPIKLWHDSGTYCVKNYDYNEQQKLHEKWDDKYIKTQRNVQERIRMAEDKLRRQKEAEERRKEAEKQRMEDKEREKEEQRQLQREAMLPEIDVVFGPQKLTAFLKDAYWAALPNQMKDAMPNVSFSINTPSPRNSAYIQDQAMAALHNPEVFFLKGTEVADDGETYDVGVKGEAIGDGDSHLVLQKDVDADAEWQEVQQRKFRDDIEKQLTSSNADDAFMSGAPVESSEPVAFSPGDLSNMIALNGGAVTYFDGVDVSYDNTPVVSDVYKAEMLEAKGDVVDHSNDLVVSLMDGNYKPEDLSTTLQKQKDDENRRAVADQYVSGILTGTTTAGARGNKRLGPQQSAIFTGYTIKTPNISKTQKRIHIPTAKKALPTPMRGSPTGIGVTGNKNDPLTVYAPHSPLIAHINDTTIPANLRISNAFRSQLTGNSIFAPNRNLSPIPTEYLDPPPPGGLEIVEAYVPRKIPDPFEIDIHVPKLKSPDNDLNFDLSFDDDSTHIKTETLPDPVDPPFPAVSFNIAPPDVEQSMPPPQDFDPEIIHRPELKMCISSWATSTPTPGSTDIPETELFPAEAPRTVREMLQWLAGLRNQKHHETLKQCIEKAFSGLHKDPSQLALSINHTNILPDNVFDILQLTAMFAGSVLTAIAPRWRANVSSRFVKPKSSDQSDEPDCCALLCQLRDYAYACHHQLEFLKSQCNREKSHGGWQNCNYGSDPKKPSPLQAFLTDAYDSTFKTHLFDPCNLCHKSRIRMGFKKNDSPEKSQTGNILATILTPSCGGSDPLLTLASYLNCLTKAHGHCL
ncbi:Ribosome-binding protein 1 [Babesia bigemina]|uniref:Ribosome-binding protein 1 n=1 Tax=Babesia bigemina TaxID=5866 RepID=A0A061D3X6_BABBI|nr:Ribosome-binding protein 1 [Babesia bigemina]CDR94757.1 Ribosome-binding protein 1 [Babesia bigemina]|eukprot:XP_012766943.1 Ribosome-binding protein 1 [Babesia bigemina]